MMLSVVIPTLDAEEGLAATLTALVPAMVEGLLREVIVVDAGSRDHTIRIAEAAGVEVVHSARGRGLQLAAGAARARSPWLLFLHADTVLQRGWEDEVAALIERVDIGQRPPTAAAFRFALDDIGFKPRLIEAGVTLRCTLFRLPYGDQGLLIPASLYREIGGHNPLPIMEDVDIVRRLGRKRMVILRSEAVTSAIRYKREGYLARVARNAACLALYMLKASPARIARYYGASRSA
jgi:rSAM/selenodomain-associated transferase 2